MWITFCPLLYLRYHCWYVAVLLPQTMLIVDDGNYFKVGSYFLARFLGRVYVQRDLDLKSEDFGYFEALGSRWNYFFLLYVCLIQSWIDYRCFVYWSMSVHASNVYC
jgi:hypothetical protein